LISPALKNSWGAETSFATEVKALERGQASLISQEQFLKALTRRS
jgi:hypothetical protein